MPDNATGQMIDRNGFTLFLALITLGLLYIVWPFAAPLLWATLAAILFQPLHQWFLRLMPGGKNRAAIATLLIITFVVLLPALFIGSMIVNEATGVFIAFQEGRIDIAAWFTQILDALPFGMRHWIEQSVFGEFSVLQDRAQEFLKQSTGIIAQGAVAFGGGVFGFVLSFGVGLYVTYFLLRDGNSLGATVVRHLPLDPRIARHLADKFLSIVRATIKGSVVVGLVQGALGALTFWIAGMPAVFLFGMLIAICSLLPAIGTAIIWAPTAAYLLATGAIWQGVLVVVSGVAVIGMADNLLRPILVGRDTGIPDWLVLVTTLGGIAIMGLAGIVVGPVMAGLFIAIWSMQREQRETAPPLSAS